MRRSGQERLLSSADDLHEVTSMNRREFILGGTALAAVCRIPADPDADVRSLVPWREGHLQIHFIYTGVAESVFILYPDSTSLLIDCGDHPAHRRGKYAVPILPSLKRHAGEWVARYVLRVNPRREKVDYMLLTHYHNDHAGARSYHAGLAPNGEYYLSGFGQAMEYLSFGKAIDRAWPTFDDPLPRRLEDDSWTLAQMVGVYRELQRRGTVVERFQLEKNSDQLAPLHGATPGFGIRPLCANGRILMPDGSVRDLYADYIARAKPQSVNENAMSIGLKFTYGPFGLYTAGDFEDHVPQPDGSRLEVEDAIAETVGRTTIAKMDHHGHNSMSRKLVAALCAQAYVGCVWDWFHADDATMSRLADRNLYKGDRLLCPGVFTDARRKRDAMRPWQAEVPEACYGGVHIVADVPPGGKTFGLSFVSAADESMTVLSNMELRTCT